MKKSFGIIEVILVLLVFVGISGMIATAQYGSATDKSKDARRKANLNQATAAVAIYFSDNGLFPGEGASGTNIGTVSLNQIKQDLVPVYINSIPSDPEPNRSIRIFASGKTQNGEYAYAPITRNQTKYAGMVLGANIENEGSSPNRVVLGNKFETGVNTPKSIGYEINLDNLGYIKTSSNNVKEATEAIELEKTICNQVKIDISQDASMLDSDNCIANTNDNMVYISIQ